MGQFASPFSSYARQAPTPEERASELLGTLSPEERVGQLFLIDFDGIEIDDENPILELIINGHIGGVVVSAKNNNILGPNNVLINTQQLTQNLQRTEWSGSVVSQTNPFTGEEYLPAFIPLFISITQDGDGYPNDQILSSLTPIPSQMAVGATWNPNFAQQAGEILGKELYTLGFNLLFGPSLNVAEDPHPENLGDLGVNTFGGNPYWVGVLGQSFISGVHSGSLNHIAVVAKNFPGYIGSDLPKDEDIPSVRKPLEQLRETEFAPFFAVTSLAPSQEANIDGVLLSHIKYQGLQGNLQPSTRPISFDPEGFGELINQPEFSAWRDTGGLVISDELGTRAIRRFFDPTEGVFNASLVALNAFLSGNDLLQLGDIIADTDPDSITTVQNTLEFFARKYREDLIFAERVDAAVLRILTLKFSLYTNFTIENILSNQFELEDIGNSDDMTFRIASEAVTLLSPSRENLNVVLPAPLRPHENLVIFVDSFDTTQCDACSPQSILEKTGLEDALIRLYGPDATGQIFRRNLFSFTYDELDNSLNIAEDENNLVL
ncbi:MAG: hypothetical protein N2D54_06980, partial [Chloroflexota bacterium]